MALKNEMSNITPVQLPSKMTESVHLDKATTSDTFAVGDLIEADSQAGSCKVVDAATVEAFIGVSLSVSLAAGTNDEIWVAFYGAIEAYLASDDGATVYFGESAAWDAGANGTDWYLTKATNDAIVHCLSKSIAVGSKGYWMFDSYGTRNVTGLSFFDLPATT